MELEGLSPDSQEPPGVLSVVAVVVVVVVVVVVAEVTSAVVVLVIVSVVVIVTVAVLGSNIDSRSTVRTGFSWFFSVPRDK
jgi:hypothetical protein